MRHVLAVMFHQARIYIRTTCRGWMGRATVRRSLLPMQTSTDSSKNCLCWKNISKAGLMPRTIGAPGFVWAGKACRSAVVQFARRLGKRLEFTWPVSDAVDEITLDTFRNRSLEICSQFLGHLVFTFVAWTCVFPNRRQMVLLYRCRMRFILQLRYLHVSQKGSKRTMYSLELLVGSYHTTSPAVPYEV